MTTPHITEVRQSLLDTLKDLRCRENPMDVDRAKAVALVAGVLVDTARVEVEFLKATDGLKSDFLGAAPALPELPALEGTGVPTPHNPFPRATRQGARA